MKSFTILLLFFSLSIGSVLQANAFANHQFMQVNNPVMDDMPDCHKDKSDKKEDAAKCFSFCQAMTIAKLIIEDNKSFLLGNTNSQVDTYVFKKYSIKLPNPERPPIS